MITWVDELRHSMSIFWLAGLAGTGKSAIAKIYCEQLTDKGPLTATFFMSRISAERRDLFNIKLK
jgi:adenylylsulfate kinase-like enzyme